jgi:predicted transcriptional regulator
MGRLDPEARMTIKALAARGTTRSEIARLLGVTEGAVRHHLRRMAAGVADGRSLRPMRAESQAEAIEHWRSQQGEGGVNLAAGRDAGRGVGAGGLGALPGAAAGRGSGEP